MFRLPSYAPLAAGVLTTWLTFVLIVAPLDVWWGWVAPRELAQYRLAQSPFLARTAHADHGCPWAQVQAWRQLRGEPDAAAWFRGALAQQPTPAGQVLATAGLFDLDAPAFAHAIAALARSADSVTLWYGERVERRPVRALAAELSQGTLTAALLAVPLHPEHCGA